MNMKIKFALFAFIITGGFTAIALSGCEDKDADSAEEVEALEEEAEEEAEEAEE